MQLTPVDRIMTAIETLCKNIAQSETVLIGPIEDWGDHTLPLVVIQDEGFSTIHGETGYGIDTNTATISLSFATDVYGEELASRYEPRDLQRWLRSYALEVRGQLGLDFTLGGLINNSELGPLEPIDPDNSDMTGAEMTFIAMYYTEEGKPFVLACDT
ncbi:MAG: hypothetical protein AAGA36_00225 [Pseudomonadota bacterium]